jgi:hypothetical protein
MNALQFAAKKFPRVKKKVLGGLSGQWPPYCKLYKAFSKLLLQAFEILKG